MFRPAKSDSRTTGRKRIVEYYDSCEIDYRLNWHLDSCHALHIGYWDETTKTLPDALVRQNEIKLERAKIKASDRVLDAGCGIGGSAIFLAQRVGCDVVGITLSEKQAKSATSLAAEKGVGNKSHFQVMDFCNTGFADESFDVVWALESSCYAGRKEDFILDAYRILKKGGRLIISDGFLVKDHYTALERKLVDLWITRWAVDSLESTERFHRHLDNAGFKNIDYTDITTNVAPSSRRLFLMGLATWPLAKALELMKQRTKIQNDNLGGAIFQYLVLLSRLGKYGMFYAEKA